MNDLKKTVLGMHQSSSLHKVFPVLTEIAAAGGYSECYSMLIL